MLDLLARKLPLRGALLPRPADLPPLALIEVPLAVLPDEPPVTIEESVDQLRVIAEVPGWSADQVEVSLAEGTLRLRGERRGDEGPSFDRVVNLTAPVDPRAADATLARGRLVITLNKLPTGTTRIPVREAD